MSGAPTIRVPGRTAFTFLEVVGTLMVVGVGLLAVIALAVDGLGASARSAGSLSGMATAVTVAVDPQPYLDDASAPAWSYAPYPLSGTGPLSGVAQGPINGYWAVRTETSGDADIIAQDPTGTVYARGAEVSVDVFDTIQGHCIASYHTRLIRQRATP